MSFYLLPPEGIVSYKKLEDYGLRRLHFLLRLVRCRNDNEIEDVIQDTSVVDHSDCLIIGSVKDTVSHYILRLLIGGCYETAAFLLESEAAFFRLQLERMDKGELTEFFQCLEKNLKRLKVSSCYQQSLSGLQCLVKWLKGTFPSWSNLAELMSDANSSVSVCLPFSMALKLVASREVELNKGMAIVPVTLLKDVLNQQHHIIMSAFIRQAAPAREVAIRDERIRRLAGLFKRVYKSQVALPTDMPIHCLPLSLPALSSSEAMFPPCMNNLMKVLRQRHRLKHKDRVQLTLFLKELGLPLHDALLLWKHEYSLPDKAGVHKGWQDNERRYIYNIQHLYGLQGSRINYRAHSCSYIQGRSLSSGDCGGCPFASQDKTALSSLTADIGLEPSDLPILDKLLMNRDFSAACQLYMTLKQLQEKEKSDPQQMNLNFDLKEQTNKKTCAHERAGLEQPILCCDLPSDSFSSYEMNLKDGGSNLPLYSMYQVLASNDTEIHSKENSVNLSSANLVGEHCIKASCIEPLRCSCVLKSDLKNHCCSAVIHLQNKYSKNCPHKKDLTKSHSGEISNSNNGHCAYHHTCSRYLTNSNSEQLKSFHSHIEDLTNSDGTELTKPLGCSKQVINSHCNKAMKINNRHTLLCSHSSIAQFSGSGPELGSKNWSPLSATLDKVRCHECSIVHKDNPVPLALGSHKKPSECYWIVQNREKFSTS